MLDGKSAMLNAVRGVVITLLVFAIALFVGDWAWYKLSGSQHSVVTVERFISAPLKNNKQELDYLGSEDVPCSLSLLPQEGMAPCWYLRRHTKDVRTY